MPRHQYTEHTFQAHIATFLEREHRYRALAQDEIADAENAIAEEELWSFLDKTQSDALRKLADDYGTDARAELFRALRRELATKELWRILRDGLTVRGVKFQLYYPKPRSAESAATAWIHNRYAYRQHFHFGPNNEEIDFVFFLNGLPIVALEVKHETNQTVHDAVAQFAGRDRRERIFRNPFLYLAADTSEVMAATDPCRVENFRWHNMGLTNSPLTEGEYPVEYLYREVLAPEQLLEALAFFLVYVPPQDARDDRPAHPAYCIFPRYHQSRMVRGVADHALAHFVHTGDVGGKYLIEHSAGSGKTLSICWLADRLHSLYHPRSNDKLVDITFILTDRRTLDKNIQDDLANFTHLQNVVGLAKRANDLPAFLRQRKPIIVTTLQKFAWVLKELQQNPRLRDLRVAFLIDEAHRSQEGRMAAGIRTPFRAATRPLEAPDAEDADDTMDEEERTAEIIRAYDRNQLFVAFTATPSPATVSLFGAPFDTYSEAEAIAEGYIVDVASSIISYKTLYNLHSPVVPTRRQETLYPKGVVSKALQNVAYQDDGLIQYKAEVMLRIFEEDVRPLIGGRAKAMIVATSRLAGLRYYEVVKEKLRERDANYKVLYAFSDFTHPETNETVTEHAVNGLADGELIEERFEGDDYRILVVASKFQTGFDQPLLVAMFLDKPVTGRNAIQTVSRLNRKCDGKDGVVVVDFTNNARAILAAFQRYRQGTPFEPVEPDPQLVSQLHQQILAAGVFTQNDAVDFVRRLQTETDAQLQFMVNTFRSRLQQRMPAADDRKAFVYRLARFARSFRFLSCFFAYSLDLETFAVFAEYVGPQLIKQGQFSELMQQIRHTRVIKAAVQYLGKVHETAGQPRVNPSAGRPGQKPVLQRVSLQEMIENIRKRFEISDEEALYIRQVTEEKSADPDIGSVVEVHRLDQYFLHNTFQGTVNGEIRETYRQLGRYEELADDKYTDRSGIFDIMAYTVIQTHLARAA